MPISFPSSPTLNQEHQTGGRTWFWDGERWSPRQANLTSVSTSVIPMSGSTYDLGHSTAPWKDLYLSGNSLILGSLAIKDIGGNVISFFKADGISPATISSDNVDTTTIRNGNSSVSVQSLNGNLVLSVNNTKMMTISNIGVTIGNIVLKDVGANTIAFFRSDGNTAATISSNNVDTSQIANGTSRMSVPLAGGSIFANVNNVNIATMTSAGMFANTANIATLDVTSAAVIKSTTAASSTSTGALRVSGGVGILGSLYSGVSIYAVGDIVTNFSDIRLKTITGKIKDPLAKLTGIDVFYYHANDLAVELGAAHQEQQVGVSAQSVERNLPEAVVTSPLNDNYKTVKYERLVPLLIEAIKELQNQIKDLKDGLSR